MYQRDIPHLPTKISREEFVDHVFELGLRNSHSYESIMVSVQLGDNFVTFSGDRVPFIELNREEKIIYREERKRRKKIPEIIHDTSVIEHILNQRPKTFIDEVVPQVYSIELAHVVTVIVAKANEEFGYKQTCYAVADTCNHYVVKMEWEICILLTYHIKIYTFLSVLCWEKRLILRSMFQDLCREICMNYALLHKDPRVVALAVIILFHRKRLRAIQTSRRRIFHEIMLLIAREYELPVKDILQEYIKLKQ